MSQFIQSAFFTVLGGFIAGGVGLCLANHRRVLDAKDAFGVFIRGKIGGLPKREVGDFYKSTKPAIRAEVHQFWHFLNREQRTRLDRLWKEYDEIQAHELDPQNEATMGEAMRSFSKLAGIEFQSPYEVVRFYLDEFYKFSA